MNQTQTTTVATVLVGYVAGILSQKFPQLDIATWTALVTAIGGVIAGLAAYFTRGTVLADTVGKMSETTVITKPEIADALPNNKDVVSNAEVKVVPK